MSNTPKRYDTLETVRSDFVRVTDPDTGRFLFEVDLNRLIVIVVNRGKETVVDLARLREKNTTGA